MQHFFLPQCNLILKIYPSIKLKLYIYIYLQCTSIYMCLQSPIQNNLLLLLLLLLLYVGFGAPEIYFGFSRPVNIFFLNIPSMNNFKN